MPEYPNRQSNRFPGHDYAWPATYLVTIVTRLRMTPFGDVIDEKMHLSDEGQIVWNEWRRSAELRSEIVLDQFVVMPNHIHGIVLIVPAGFTVGPRGLTPVCPVPSQPALSVAPFQSPSHNLGAMVRGFKAATTSRINRLRGRKGPSIWQRDFDDRIILDQAGLHFARRYIEDNPRRWAH